MRMNDNLPMNHKKTMTKFAIQVFFCKNAPVEYIGIYTDTKKARLHEQLLEPGLPFKQS